MRIPALVFFNNLLSKKETPMHGAGRQPDENGNVTYLNELQNGLNRTIAIVKTVVGPQGEIISQEKLPLTAPCVTAPDDDLVQYLLQLGFAAKKPFKEPQEPRIPRRTDAQGHAIYLVELQDSFERVLKRETWVYCYNPRCPDALRAESQKR